MAFVSPLFRLPTTQRVSRTVCATHWQTRRQFIPAIASRRAPRSSRFTASPRRYGATVTASAVTEGSMAPDFTLMDQDGKPTTLSEFRGQPVVLAFYPGASTPGCTKELCRIRDDFPKFEKLNAVVLGVSSNTVEEQKRFAMAQQYPFRLLADVGGKVRKLYGVPATLGLLAGRVTYVIDKDGKVVKVHNSQMDFESHAVEAEKALSLLGAGGA